MDYISKEYGKVLKDKKLMKKAEKWGEFNGGKNMPLFGFHGGYTTYKSYKKAFLEEYEKLGIDD